MDIELHHDVIELVCHKHLWLAKWCSGDLHKHWYKMTPRNPGKDVVNMSTNPTMVFIIGLL